jgi:hypothetical protein
MERRFLRTFRDSFDAVLNNCFLLTQIHIGSVLYRSYTSVHLKRFLVTSLYVIRNYGYFLIL